MKIGLILAAVIVGVSIVTILGLVSSSEDVNQNKLRIAYFPNIGHAVPIIGVEKGFFQSGIGDGVIIETRVFDSGPQVIESLFANSVDIAYVGPGPAINGFLNSQNKNINILAGAASGGASFIVHPNSEINHPSDFVVKNSR